MFETRHVPPAPEGRRHNAGLIGFVAAALTWAPILSPLTAPATVEARMEQAVPAPCDFTTSGGFVVTDAGQKANFGVHGGCKNGEFWGHLNLVDHATGYHVNSVEITAYVAPFPSATAYPKKFTRDVCGIAETNDPNEGQIFFRARLVDGGEPGTLDMFGLKLSNGKMISVRPLGTAKPGGNVQLHDPNPSTLPHVNRSVACGGLAFGDEENNDDDSASS